MYAPSLVYPFHPFSSIPTAFGFIIILEPVEPSPEVEVEIIDRILFPETIILSALVILGQEIPTVFVNILEKVAVDPLRLPLNVTPPAADIPELNITSEPNVPPAAEIPALNLTSELKVAPAALMPPGKFVRALKVFVPVKVCVPASPARVVVKAGRDTVIVLAGAIVGSKSTSPPDRSL